MLELISYHQIVLIMSAQLGKAEADNMEKIKMLESFKTVVDSRAIQRKQKHENEIQENKTFMASRLNVECAICQTEQQVKIIVEERHKPLGFVCDIVV